MMERQLQRQLNFVAARLRQVRLWSGVAIVLLVSSLVSGSLLWLPPFQASAFSSAVTQIVVITACAVAATSTFALWRPVDYRQVATQIERRYPDLKCALLTAVEQRPELPNGQYGFLQQQVIEQVLTHGFRHRWSETAATSRLRCARLGAMLAALLLTLTLAGLHASRGDVAASESNLDLAQAIRVNTRFEVTVEPGDVQVEHNRDLLVLARFTESLPSEVTLVYETDNGQQHRVPMRQNLDDPVFGARIPSIQAPLTYHVAFADQASDRYDVRVFRYPELERADAHLVYPSFTDLADKQIEDVRHLSAVAGTELTLLCLINKAVASAELVGAGGEVIALDSEEANAKLRTTSWVLTESMRLRLRLRDAEGRENQYPPQFVINVLPNRLPDLQMKQPAGDQQVSPLEEMDLQATAWDDFGLHRLGISLSLPGLSLPGLSLPGLSLPGMTQQEIVLGESLAAKARVEAEYTVFFEALKAKPDQLLAYHFWAEDLGLDGAKRRVSSDIYFAEVRHFEEIFRQGQQPTNEQQRQQQQQSQQGSAQRTQELVELQKQIIGGTWKLMRREAASAASESFDEDTHLLLLSQQSAALQLAELAQQVQNPESLTHMQTVRQAMESAVTKLQATHEASTAQPPLGDLSSTLKPALAAEQAAYQGLLQLRAHEFEVVRSQQGQQQGQSRSSQQSASNRSQQQLDQLQLEQDENRYEEQRLAQPPAEPPADRENRQILNRLRELARRQSDLNERIQELQSELTAVKEQSNRDEIRHQLKRLREQQEEILRDSDELAARMDQQPNQETMAEQQQQIESARQQAQRTSAALAEGQVSQAAASGSRVERELNELRDEFRRRLSTRFQEQMRDMQRAAERIERQENDIAERLAKRETAERPARSLQDDNEQEALLKNLKDQKEQVDALLEEMESVVEEAETSEPLLAQQLYDTYRSAQQQDLSEAFRSTQLSLDRGTRGDAQAQERRAREGIQDLREGIDRAAESVLGDDTEALRRAREELDRLTQQLDQEIARNDRELSEQDSSEQEAAGQELAENQQADLQAIQLPPARDDNPGDQPRDPPASPSSRGGETRRLTGEPRGATNRLQQNRPGKNGNPAFAPIAGEDFLDWSDRLRDVEEMIDAPRLRAEAARVRDRARGIRQDLKRHSKPPNWELVKANVLEPLVELHRQVDQELLRRTGQDTLVPIDRDPVPPKYAEQIRLYYERLGRGR